MLLYRDEDEWKRLKKPPAFTKWSLSLAHNRFWHPYNCSCSASKWSFPEGICKLLHVFASIWQTVAFIVVRADLFYKLSQQRTYISRYRNCESVWGAKAMKSRDRIITNACKIISELMVSMLTIGKKRKITCLKESFPRTHYKYQKTRCKTQLDSVDDSLTCFYSLWDKQNFRRLPSFYTISICWKLFCKIHGSKWCWLHTFTYLHFHKSDHGSQNHCYFYTKILKIIGYRSSEEFRKPTDGIEQRVWPWKLEWSLC